MCNPQGKLGQGVGAATLTDGMWMLCRSEAIRTGFMLAQGGEFAFVLLSLAKELKVLPDELNRLLIIVVVLSMALTPLLADLGEFMAEKAVEAGAGVAPHPYAFRSLVHDQYSARPARSDSVHLHAGQYRDRLCCRHHSGRKPRYRS